ncbi:MFS transporter [Limosilactobacillus reuteri]|uniref:MFS transporter n=1 Tax=Limosilactobacillus reuteri TaxID=1598 RepID=UPI00234B25DF|nr:MFS transporter [Limosilactobacillus reuteri]MDC6076034.1 MFS transporter [Limosilactobacillus reuteri]
MWNQRYKHNVIIYLIIYGILGGVTGITNNELLSYLQIISPKIVAGISMCYAATSLVLAALILAVNKVGYKKLLLVAPPVTIISILVMTTTKNVPTVLAGYIVSQTFISLYDVLYPIMFASYVPSLKQSKLFSIALIDNLACQALVTMISGHLVVWLFSKLANIKYSLASYWSGYQDKMSIKMLASYTLSYRIILWIAACMMVVAFAFSFLMKEKPSDYRSVNVNGYKTKLNLSKLKRLMTKPVLVFISFTILINFGASLVTPYIPIYLNNYLHIPRGMTANINTVQTAAMFIGYFSAPWLEKKFGTVVSVGATTIACIPMMIMLGIGNRLGTGLFLVITIIVAYFFRSGVANSAIPIQNILQMSIVDKDLRTDLTALIQIISVAVSLITGLFTEMYLFKTLQGYATAYYIASVLYLVGSLVLMIFLYKQFNRREEQS